MDWVCVDDHNVEFTVGDVVLVQAVGRPREKTRVQVRDLGWALHLQNSSGHPPSADGTQSVNRGHREFRSG
jgi:hypothetical protein